MAKIKGYNNYKINNLNEYLETIRKISKNKVEVLYRGHSSEKYKLKSSALRFLEANNKSKISLEELKEYHESLLIETNRLKDNKFEQSSDVLQLAHLQHHGAKTNLIDFTENPLVALWFACIGNNDKDGAVLCFTKSCIEIYDDSELKKFFDTQSNFGEFDSGKVYYKYRASYVDRRIIAQYSVFVISPLGEISEYEYDKITIKKEYKDNILSELLMLGISAENLFPDYEGLIEWYDYYGEKKVRQLYNEGIILLNNFNINDAIKVLQKALKLRSENDLKNKSLKKPLINSIIIDKLGKSYELKADLDEALNYYKKSLKIREEVYEKEHPDIAVSYNNIGLVYSSKGDLDKALKYFTISLEVMKKAYGKEHPEVAGSYNNIGLVYKSKGDLDKALKYFTISFEVMKKVCGEEHLYVAIGYNNIGLVYKSKGDLDKALKYFTISLEIREKAYGKEHPEVSKNYNNIGLVYKSKGDLDKALKYFTISLEVMKKAYGEEHPEVAGSYNNIGSVHKSKGDLDKALKYFTISLEIREKAYGKEHPDIAVSYYNIGSVYKSKGDLKKALEFYEKSLEIFLMFGETYSNKVQVVKKLIKNLKN